MSTQQKALTSERRPTLNAVQKAAIILASLGPDVAGPVMQAISDRHLRAFVDAVERLNSVPAPLRQQVVIEFIAEVERKKDGLPGGADEARRILAALGDEERIARLLGSGAAPGESSSGSVWARVDAAPEESLVEYLATLHPAAAALVLRQLPFEKIASLMSAADQAAAKEMLTALSRETGAAPEMIAALAEAVEIEFLQPLEKKPRTAKVSELANEVVSLLPAAKRDELLQHLEAHDPEAAAEIKAALITFEGLPEKLDEAGAAALLRGVVKETLLVALVHGKKSAPNTVEFLMANVSKRMAEQYGEEMEEMTDVADVEGEAAQRKICSEVRRMIRNGDIDARK